MSKVYSMKINDDNLIKKIDEFCEEKPYSKASIMKIAVETYIDQQKALDELPSKAKETIRMIKKIEKMLSDEKNKYGLDEIKKQK